MRRRDPTDVRTWDELLEKVAPGRGPIGVLSVGRAISMEAFDVPLFAATCSPNLVARMWQFFEPELSRRLSELEAGTTVAARVRAVLLERLPAGEGSIEAVAHDLTMSARTLQRRLRAEGTTFQSVLDSTRESLARHYLAESELSAGEISFLLGYADPRSFYRAVQAWTGQTPQLVRAAAG